MRIRLVVTDLDGTLLRRDKSVSDYTTDVFARLRERGVKVLFATGRPERTTARFANSINPHGIISNNGANVTIAGSSIFERGIDSATVEAIVNGLLGFDGIKLFVDYGDYSVTNHGDYKLLEALGWSPIYYNDFSDYDSAGVLKIAIEAQDASLLANVDFGSLGCWIHGTAGEPWYLVMSKGATKSRAIKAAASHFGIDIEEVCAFGDDENDIDMLRECGVGIAMENAIDDAKAAADYICSSNEDDGVAKWLEEHVLV